MRVTKPIFTLINKKTSIPFVFVIPPVDLTISARQKGEIVDVIDLGTVFKDGNREYLRISFSGFFPRINSHFYNLMNPLPPSTCAEYLRTSMTNNDVFRFLVPQFLTFVNVKIETFETFNSDHTGDLDYRITLVEDRTNELANVDILTGLFRRL